MTRKLITRISNEIGNQLFMYASTFAIAKKLDRKLLIDNETSFKSKKTSVNMDWIISQSAQILLTKMTSF